MSRSAQHEGALITALMQPDLYDHPVAQCELIETHISWVILAGDYAYKIKKPLNLGFLDFSTIEKRRFYCEEELRLNRRLAPSLYLSVMAITGTPDNPQWTDQDADDAIEYAVKMKVFPQHMQLDRLQARGELQARHMDALAQVIADFHMRIAVAGDESEYGDPDHVQQPVDENFTQIRQRIVNKELLQILDELEHWMQSCFASLRPRLEQRKAGGSVRECHGDLHLRNIAWLDDAPLVFDCIEFNANLRWIDVISEVAFLVMDLQDRNRFDLAQRFLNSWLEHTGDYHGLRVLRFYLLYRALVRAKVDAIRAQQPGIGDNEAVEAERECAGYLALASTYTQPLKPQLIITHGVSASGKSTLTRSLLEQLPAIRIRSDVERKRMHGLYPQISEKAVVDKADIYSAEATRKTYNKLLQLAALIVNAGYTVIVDAVFLNLEEREQFRKLAAEKQLPFIILELQATAETLRRRISARESGVSDADLSVLEMQLAKWTPLAESELPYVITVDTEATFDAAMLAKSIMGHS